MAASRERARHRQRAHTAAAGDGGRAHITGQLCVTRHKYEATITVRGRPPAGLALPEPAQRGRFDAGAGIGEPDPLGMLEPIQSDDGAESWWGDHVASELVHILLEPGAFLECHSRRLTWSADSACYVITNGDDDSVYVSDLLAALRELRGPEAVGAGEHETATATVVEDGPGF